LVAGESANPDADAQRNLVEYALGGDPFVDEQAPLTRVDATYGRLSLQFARNALATDLTLTVLGADDLAGPWLELARSVGGQPFESAASGVTIGESITGAFRSVEVRDIFAIGDPNHPTRFLKLQIVK
jgi:hypothetical protein